MTGPISELHALGQSLWYDNIERRMLTSGKLAELIQNGDIRGVTSNPSIFNNAIGKSNDYDSALVSMAWAGWPADQIFYQLAVEDIRDAADLFMPLYADTRGGDGYVSLEVSPYLAQTTEGTVAEARRLWQLVNRPNLMVKIPATMAGIPAIEQAIAEGININVTLIFSLVRYAQVMDAYVSGLEKRAAAGLPIEQVASVASFFVSRVDSKVDQQLQALIRQEGPNAGRASQMLGKAAIANAKLAYAQFLEIFGTVRFQRLRENGARVQRPLWASTSTKNPDYRDVVYVEELIGPDTVDTVPPQTLDAFRDHGKARLSIVEGLPQAQQNIAELEALGISMEAVTRELEGEGVKAFSDAFTALLKTIEDRRSLAIEELGPLQADVPLRVGMLERDSVPRRLHAGDASLWTQDPDGQQEVSKRLGWLALPFTSRMHLGEYERFAAEVIEAGFTHALLLGMGGSSLAPEVFSLMGEPAVKSAGRKSLKLTVLDSTDPDQVAAAARANPLRKTIYLVSSKSGTTSEVSAFLDYFWAQAVEQLGERAAEHFVAITDPGTPLESLGLERKFRRVFLADPNVGGRYSALTAFGLVPAAMVGLELNRLLDSAARMARECAPDVPAGRNPGLVLGTILGEAALQGRDKLTLVAEPAWEPFGAWLEQLIAESSGKQGKGILPVAGEPLAASKEYGPDRLFVYFCQRGDLEKKVEALRKNGFPAITFPVGDVYDLGAEMYRWEVATAIACAILGVNAFDQPDVQDNKTRTTAKVKSFGETGRLEETAPVWTGEGVRVFGEAAASLGQAGDLDGLLNEFLATANPGDFVAINAYIPRTQGSENLLRRFRTKIRKETKLATTVGFGPRFLHSTGQLHKGGANNGLFIQITREPSADLDIPGEPVTFKTLERAQALGDLEALQARGRRVIRIHFEDGKIERLIR